MIYLWLPSVTLADGIRLTLTCRDSYYGNRAVISIMKVQVLYIETMLHSRESFGEWRWDDVHTRRAYIRCVYTQLYTHAVVFNINTFPLPTSWRVAQTVPLRLTSVHDALFWKEFHPWSIMLVKISVVAVSIVYAYCCCVIILFSPAMWYSVKLYSFIMLIYPVVHCCILLVIIVYHVVVFTKMVWYGTVNLIGCCHHVSSLLIGAFGLVE